MKSHSKRGLGQTRKRPLYFPASLAEDSSDNLRASPTMSVPEWRNLTYDSSIQILNIELDDTFHNDPRLLPGIYRDINQTMSSISEYGPEVLTDDTEDSTSHLIRDDARSRRCTGFPGNISTSDILTNTWDDLKDARLVSYLKEVNSVKSFYNTNPSNNINGRTLGKRNSKLYCQKQCLLNKISHEKPYTDSVLDLSKVSKYSRVQTGNDTYNKSVSRKYNHDTCSQKGREPDDIEELTLVEPLQETRVESKIAPVKRVKLSPLQKGPKARMYIKRRQHYKREAVCLAENGKDKTRTSQRKALASQMVSRFMSTEFPTITREAGSLSNFLMENETIPSINSATPVIVSDKNIKSAKCSNPAAFTRTPSLRSSRPRSMATSDLRTFKCKRTLDFNNGSFESDKELEPMANGTLSGDQFNEYETVLNLCTRKPRLGTTIKKTNDQVLLDKDAVMEIKHAISSKSNRRMNIRTNGTIKMLPKITKVNSYTTKSPRRANNFACSRRRKEHTMSSDFQFRAVFESLV